MSRLRGDELLLGAEPVLDGVAPGLEMDVVRTRRDVLPGEHDRLCRLRLLRAARDGLLDRRLLRRGGLGGLAWHYCPLPVVAGLPFRLRAAAALSSIRLQATVRTPRGTAGQRSAGRQPP